MTKTILYIAVLAVLGFGIYFFLFRTNDNLFGRSEAGFTIKDTADIGKIYIVSNDGESVTVERTDSAWMVNKKYKAMPSTLNLILVTLTQQAALYPVTKIALDNVIKTMSTDATKVEIYGRDGKKISAFYVGGTAVNNTGTNMLMEGASSPYVVQVATFNGSLNPRYTTLLKDWRDRTVFNMPPDEIKRVSVQYIDKPINSFEIIRNKDNITINADPAISRHLDSPNTRRAKVFLKMTRLLKQPRNIVLLTLKGCTARASMWIFTGWPSTAEVRTKQYPMKMYQMIMMPTGCTR